MPEAGGRRRRGGLEPVRRVGRVPAFAFRLVRAAGASLRHPGPTLRQVRVLSLRTCPATVVAGVLVGMALALRGDVSPAADVAALLLRDAGPLAAALLFAAGTGTALAAEIGRMKQDEQFAALDMMALDPFRRVLAPRFAAGIVAVPLLAALLAAAGAAGVHVVTVGLPGGEPQSFWPLIRAGAGSYALLVDGALRSVLFGAAIGGLALFEGCDCVPTPAGIDRAATRAAVGAVLAVLALQVAITAGVQVYA